MSNLYNLKKDVSDSTNVVNKVTEYSANGAIAIESHTALITKGTAAAMTLAVPSTEQNGTIIHIISKTAAAHTVTATTVGFNLGDAASDVGTFGGAIADGFSVQAWDGEWYVLPGTNLNVTLA